MEVMEWREDIEDAQAEQDEHAALAAAAQRRGAPRHWVQAPPLNLTAACRGRRQGGWLQRSLVAGCCANFLNACLMGVLL